MVGKWGTEGGGFGTTTLALEANRRAIQVIEDFTLSLLADTISA
jgi:hypothetical protein